MAKFIYAVSTLAGTIIGVGFFSLPYIASIVGLWEMLAYFLVLGSLVALIHYLFGKVALATPDFLRLPGYAKIHLGNWGKTAALFSSILGSLGAILAYIVVGGGFLHNLLAPVFGGDSFIYTIFYFAAGAFLILWGIKAIAKIEFWGTILFLVILAAIFLKGLPLLKIENLFIGGFDKANFFLPYGPILFSLWGLSLVPELEEMLGKNKRLLGKIIAAAILVSALVYIFFIFLVLGVTGSGTSPEAISGLKNLLGNGVVALASFFGVLTTFTSFLAIGLTLKKTLCFDLKMPKTLAWLAACFLPFLLFLLGLKDFIKIIGLIGGVMLGVDGILVLLMYKKISGKKILAYPLTLILLGGIVYEMVYFIK